MRLPETQRLIFQPYKPTDLTVYQQLMSNSKVAKYITGNPPTVAQSKERFKYILSLNQQDNPFGFFKVINKATKKSIGLAKLVKTDEQQAEIGYAVAPDYWQSGFGTEITEGLIDFTKSATKLSSLLAIVHPQNQISISLLQKFGFLFSHPIPDPKGIEQLVHAYVLSL